MYNGFLFMKIAFIYANSADPDEMLHSMVFHLVLTSCLTLCMLVNFSICRYFLTLLFSKYSFRNNIRECQTAWIQIRLEILLGLIWVQTVCKTLLHSERPKLRFNSERNRVDIMNAIGLILTWDYV